MAEIVKTEVRNPGLFKRPLPVVAQIGGLVAPILRKDQVGIDAANRTVFDLVEHRARMA